MNTFRLRRTRVARRRVQTKLVVANRSIAASCRRSRSGSEMRQLLSDQARVIRIAAHELGVTSNFENASVAKNRDAIGIDDRRQPMCDHECRARARELGE